jgi:hypothetical protein
MTEMVCLRLRISSGKKSRIPLAGRVETFPLFRLGFELLSDMDTSWRWRDGESRK